MNLVSGIVVFSIIWWIIFFVVLPIGVKVDPKPQKGHANSAPVQAKIGFKFLVTTGISIIFFFIVRYLISLDLINTGY